MTDKPKVSRARKKPPPDVVDDLERPSVGAVHKVGPTYARDLGYLAGLLLGIRQGEPCHKMRLDFELSCGTARLRVFQQELELMLKLCHVTLERSNCDIIPHSSYEHRLTQSSVQSTQTDALSSEQTNKIGVDASVAADASKGLLARLVGELKAGRGRSKKSEATVRSQYQIDLITTAGRDRWQIGDAILGDARRPHSCLSGSYFGERQDTDGDVLPLCHLSWVEPSEPVEISIKATVPVSQLVVNLPGGEGAAEMVRIEAEDEVRRRASKVRAGHGAELRSRVAGLVAAKQLADAQRQAGIEVPDGECLIAVHSLLVPAIPTPKLEPGA